MGIWSCALYGNDTALDVKETYVDSLKNADSDEEALVLTLKMYENYIDAEEECMVWFALADTQWKTGRLCEKVKKRALHFLQQRAGAELFADNDKEKWFKTLEKLEQQLNRPMKPYKRLKKEKDELLKLWNVGDVYAYRFSTKIAAEKGLYGKYILMQKVDEVEGFQQKRFSVIHIFDRVFDELPVSSEIKHIRLLPIDSSFCEKREFPLVMSCVMEYIKPSEYPSARFHYIGNEDIAIRTKLYNNRSDYSWYRMEENWLCDFYIQWQDREYFEENGEYYPKSTDKTVKSTDKVRINTDKLNLSQKKIIEFILKNGKVTNKDVQQLLAVKDSRALKVLKELVEMDILVKRGKLKGSYYVLKVNDGKNI